jgi:hypothetical protein
VKRAPPTVRVAAAAVVSIGAGPLEPDVGAGELGVLEFALLGLELVELDLLHAAEPVVAAELVETCVDVV